MVSRAPHDDDAPNLVFFPITLTLSIPCNITSYLFIIIVPPKYLHYMAGYFSNHSRLHTEPAGSTTHTQTSTPRSSTPASARAPSDPPRPRPAASSRHFSTSLAGSTGARTPPVGSSVDGGSSAQVHPLRTTYVRCSHPPSITFIH